MKNKILKNLTLSSFINYSNISSTHQCIGVKCIDFLMELARQGI